MSMASRISSTRACTAGRIARTRRTVNTGSSIRRYRVCSGASVRMKGLNFAPASCSPSPRGGELGRVMSALTRGSESSSRTSSYRLTTQASRPVGRVTRATGSSVRRAAYSSGAAKGQPRRIGKSRGVGGGVLIGGPRSEWGGQRGKREEG